LGLRLNLSEQPEVALVAATHAPLAQIFMALFAHCVALTVNAGKPPWERRSSRTMATADKLAEAVSLDMTGCWRPTVRTYLGRITKARILETVREAVSIDAADQVAKMKKQGMAGAAEQLLAGTDWLPALLRTARAAHAAAESPRRMLLRGKGHRGLLRRRRVNGRAGTPDAVSALSWNHR
jgi:hypothetical protein